MKSKKPILISIIIIGIMILEILSSLHVVKLNKVIQTDETEKMIEQDGNGENLFEGFEKTNNLYYYTRNEYRLKRRLLANKSYNMSTKNQWIYGTLEVDEELEQSDNTSFVEGKIISGADETLSIGKVTLEANKDYIISYNSGSMSNFEKSYSLWFWKENSGFILPEYNPFGWGGILNVDTSGTYFVGFLGYSSRTISNLTIKRKSVTYPSENLIKNSGAKMLLTSKEKTQDRVILQKGKRYLFTADGINSNMNISLGTDIQLTQNNQIISVNESGVYEIKTSTKNGKEEILYEPSIVEIEENTVISTKNKENLIYNMDAEDEESNNNKMSIIFLSRKYYKC